MGAGDLFQHICAVSHNFKLGLLDYDKNHNRDYFGQYCNQGYLKRLLVGHITKTFFFKYLVYSYRN